MRPKNWEQIANKLSKNLRCDSFSIFTDHVRADCLREC